MLLPAAPHRVAALVVALLALRVGIDLAALLATPTRYLSLEEGYNASAAWFVAHGGLWGDLFTLQYRSFCGGCTVLTLAGTPLLLAFGDSLLTWKCLALAWTAAVGLAGWFALDRHLGRFAAFAFLVLWAFPSPGLTDVSLMLWGNHAESALLVLAALALVERPLACGIVSGIAFWFCRTSAYAIAPIVLAVLVTRRDPRVLLGVGLGALLFLMPYIPDDEGLIPKRRITTFVGRESAAPLLALVDPRELSHRLFPGDGRAVNRTAAVLVVAAIAEVALLFRRKWLLAALAPSYALAFALAGYANMQAGPNVPIMNLRYHAPWFLLLVLTTAAGAGAVATRSRLAAIALVAVPVGVFGVARVQALTRWKPDASVTRRPATAHAYFGAVGASRLDDAALDAVESVDPETLAVVGRLRGARLARAVGAGAIGVAEAVVAARDPVALAALGAGLAACGMGSAEADRLLAALDEDDARAMGRGMAFALGRNPAAEPGSGLLASAAGRSLMQRCRGRDTDATARCLHAATTDGEVLYGAGAAHAVPAADPRLAADVVTALATADPVAAAAFAAGLADPLAGTDRPDAQGCPKAGFWPGPGGR